MTTEVEDLRERIVNLQEDIDVCLDERCLLQLHSAITSERDDVVELRQCLSDTLQRVEELQRLRNALKAQARKCVS